MRTLQRGLSPFIIILIFSLVSAGTAGYVYVNNRTQDQQKESRASSFDDISPSSYAEPVKAVPKTSPAASKSVQNPTPAPIYQTDPNKTPLVTWEYDTTANQWVANGNPPQCPPLVFDSPVDITKASSILYPGQIRGSSINDYKAHGGFRFDGDAGQNITVRMPFDGYVWRGARYFLDGHMQYGFDIIHECGIMMRFGHLSELSSKFMAHAEKMRPAADGDSRTTDFQPFQKINKGEIIASKVGIPGNAGMDWGVYDLRTVNAAAGDPSFRENHYFQRWYDYYGLCWLDYLPSNEQSIAKSLPGADGKMGKTSSYCL
jgi:hypothetical protein